MAELVPGLEDVTYNLQHKCKDMLDDLQKRSRTNPSSLETKIIVSLINELLKFIKRGQLTDIYDNDDNYDIRFILSNKLKQHNIKNNEEVNKLRNESQQKDNDNAALSQELQITKQKLNDVLQEKTALDQIINTIEKNEDIIRNKNQKQFTTLQTKIRDYEDQITRLQQDIKIGQAQFDRLKSQNWQLEQQVKNNKKNNQENMNKIFYEQQELFEQNERLLLKLQELYQANDNSQQKENAEPKNEPESKQNSLQQETTRQHIARIIEKMPLALKIFLIGAAVMGFKFLND